VDDLLASVGYGKTDKADVVDKLLPEEKRKKPPSDVKEGTFEKVIRKVKKHESAIVLDGLDNLLVRFARCCSPLPGEKILGYVSRGRGIVVHRADCQRAAIIDPERRTEVQWSPKAVSQRPVKLKILTTNKPGILTALSSVFTKLEININSANCEETGNNLGKCIFTFSVRDFAQLSEVVRALNQNKAVTTIIRLPD
jgi:GTP pyrophosphokinase